MSIAPRLDELRAQLRSGAVLTPDEDLTRYTEPARGVGGPATAVVRPASTDEVRTVLRWARGGGVRLIPQGANSGLVGGSTPPPGVHDAGRAIVVLSTERLRWAPTIDPESRTAVVAAGTPLSELNQAAATHGLELPIDLGADPSIGGMAATNTGGSRMLVHGDMRAHVLGLRAVTADEHCSVIDELTTLRKHNIGPSMTQLLVGSCGAFALITEVAVELSRVPQRRATAWITPRDGESCIAILSQLEARTTRLSAYEVIAREAVDAARALGGAVRDPFSGSPAPELSILVELSGPDEVDAELVAHLAHLAGCDLLDDALVQPPAEAWVLRHRITEGLRAMGTVIGFDISVPRSSLPAFRVAARRAVHDAFPDAIVADFGHWGDGGVHCNVVFPGAASVGGTTRTQLSELVVGLAVDRFAGSFSAEHGLGPLNASWWERTVSDGTRVAVHAIASALDPLGVLGHPGSPAASRPGT